MFGGLMERPLVAADALDRYPKLVFMFDKELDCCKVLFNNCIQTAEALGEILNNSCIVMVFYFTFVYSCVVKFTLA